MKAIASRNCLVGFAAIFCLRWGTADGSQGRTSMETVAHPLQANPDHKMTDDLTGIWDGTYIQPQVGMVTFLVTLTESGGALTGNVTEPCILRACPLRTHNASITGHRSG